MSRALKLLIFIYVVAFATTGTFMVMIVNADEASQPWVSALVRNHGIVFAWHLVCWMVLGMFTNYYWDLFNLGKGLDAVQVPRILLPLMVSRKSFQNLSVCTPELMIRWGCPMRSPMEYWLISQNLSFT